MQYLLESTAGRGISPDLWVRFPAHEILAMRAKSEGVGVYPNLTSFDGWSDGTAFRGTEGANGYIYTGGSIQMSTNTMGGGIALQNGAGVIGGLTGLQWGGGAFYFSQDVDDRREAVYEVSVQTDEYMGAYAHNAFFMGFAEPDSLDNDFITDPVAGLATDKSLFGWFSENGDMYFVYQKANQGIVKTTASAIFSLTNAWWHLGLRYDQNGAIVPWYGTGDRTTVEMGSVPSAQIDYDEIAGAFFPRDEIMVPVTATKFATIASGATSVRLLACAQVTPYDPMD